MSDGSGPGLALLYLAIVLAALAVAAVSLRLARRPRPPEAEPMEEPAVEAPPSEEAESEGLGVGVAQAPATEAPSVEAPAAPPDVAAAPPEVPARPSLRDRLAAARAQVGQALGRVLGKGTLGDADWEEVEEILIRADVGATAAVGIVERVRARGGDPRAALRAELLEILGGGERDLARKADGLTVWLVTGVNGTGKTTTIGKLAAALASDGKRVVLAAADTFRAAADEQLERWAQISGAEVVKHAPGADPGAVAYDGVQAARARGADVLIVDTAGRLHTKHNLMEELSKIRRIVEREAGSPDEVLLVLDATTGQNGLRQARAFTEAVNVTGLVLTKLDGTAKGGIVIAVQRELRIPVKLVGLGEHAGDLVPFDAEEFVDALIGAGDVAAPPSGA